MSRKIVPHVVLLGLICMFAFASSAQIYVKPVIVGQPNLESCNNSVVLELNNMPDHSFISLDMGTPYPASTGDTIEDFCFFSDLNIASTVSFFSSNGYLIGWEADMLALPRYLDYEIVNYVSPSNNFYSPCVSDGSMDLVFDSIVALSGQYSIFAFNPDYTVDYQVTDPNTLSLSSLCWGNVLITLTNTQNPSDYVNFHVFVGDPNEKYINTGLEMSLSWQHANGNCEGWVQAVPTNAVGTTYNSWNNQVYNQNGQVSLCPGIYSVYTEEHDALANLVAGSIDTFIIVDNNTAYIDSALFQNPVQDTSYYNFENCLFDYWAPIDSLTYSEDTVYQSGGLTIVIFEMTLYQDSALYIVTDSLVMLNDSLIQLDVVIHCENVFKAPFMGRRIAYLRGADSHSYSQGVADIEENELDQIVLYPNPFTNELSISNPFMETIECSIYDPTGRLITQFEIVNENTTLNTSNWLAGMYLCVLTSSQGQVINSLFRSN